MTRRTWSAVLALSLAGGVYLAAMPAQASNMGFKLERDFDYLRDGQNRALRNIYWVSLPYFNGLGDVADSVSTVPGSNPPALYPNRCVGEANAPPGPAGDGIINSSDFICDMWTARFTPASGGTFAVGYVDSTTCAFVFASASIRLGNVAWGVAPDFPASGDLRTDIGYQVSIDRSPGGDPRNRAVIVGSHDPSFAGHVVSYSNSCGPLAPRQDLLAIPYHTMYRNPVEIACGLEGVDFGDTNPADDMPDQPATPPFTVCTGGLFDGTHTLAVQTVKVEDPAIPGNVNGFQSLVTSFSALGGGSVRWTPATNPFVLKPGEAYMISVVAGHNPTTFRSPHF